MEGANLHRFNPADFSRISPGNLQDKEVFNYQEKRILKYLTAASYPHFTRYHFKNREACKFILKAHHPLIWDTLVRVFNGEIKRLIINIPPGYSKTELSAIYFIAWWLSLEKSAKFIHTSYSDALVKKNSSSILDIVQSEEYQELTPFELRKDTFGKSEWYNVHGGGLFSVSAGGGVTGYRAGRMYDIYATGAIIVDDPIKVQDAYSNVRRKEVNTWFNSTLSNRIATENVPIIIIAQRLGEEDLCGMLLKGGDIRGNKWHHLMIPALQTGKSILEEYPEEYTHGIPIDYTLPPGALWPEKESEEILRAMEKVDPYTYAAQYDQRPSPLDGGIFKSEWFTRSLYDHIPGNIVKVVIYGDTAQKANEHNDYTVFIALALTDDNQVYVLDLIRGKWEAPQLESQLVAFFNKHKYDRLVRPKGAEEVKIEDKSSGTGLIQSIKQDYDIPIEPLDPKGRDKVSRATDIVKFVTSGRVRLPRQGTSLTDAAWVSDFILEFSRFTPLLNHAYDDQVDATVYGVTDLLIDGLGSIDYLQLAANS